MSPQDLQAWMAIGSMAIQMGQASVQQIRALIMLLRSDVTDAELHQILEVIKTDAGRRKALAAADIQQAITDQG